jgi:hypothetical protein
MATVLTYDHPIGRGARTATHQNRYNRIFREAAAVARVARFIYFNPFLKLFLCDSMCKLGTIAARGCNANLYSFFSFVIASSGCQSPAAALYRSHFYFFFFLRLPAAAILFVKKWSESN